MKTPTRLRLLASTNNGRGDLFTRLVGDLFFALGYDNLRFDVHKSGREIDIQGTHRLEPRRLLAECKAHAKKIGGADLNKFFGVVGRERSKDKETPVTGYFVSLSGFPETGIEQEQETGEQQRLILLDGTRVIEELIRINILIRQADAAERAGRCAEHAGLEDAVLDGAELLGHPLGYVWAVFYSRGKQRTHFALVHADGTPLATPVAQEVIEADRKCRGSLHKLSYLSPPSPGPDREALGEAAIQRYREWVVTECGDIQLDGLPADADLSAFRMRLERLFVPLKVVSKTQQADDDEAKPPQEKESITPVGEFLAEHPRFSLLAKPGGGKSTLLKRLAVAYTDPERLHASDDGLPERDWLPLFLRCRELRDRAHRPIRELLDDLPGHAGMNAEEARVFHNQMDEALRSGRALLLVDGLDEISDEGARTTFAGHLRTFLAMFPQAAMVVTSREAGYRHVAGVVASACEQVSLAPFDQPDVQRLCESWHVQVVGDSDTVRSEARQLADTIWDNERIRSLAENPLMLTTLFVVRRCCGGELPTRRVELYREAVRVLIRTWNTEGFEPMDLDETLAQLSYVACAMMNEGVQRVGHRRLLKLLQEARAEMEAELQFTRISPVEFVDRIEYRSSLLMQTGHERIDDELQPVYEFRHLTFQEYLAARGLVEEQYPDRDEAQSLTELLEPHFEDERWREVVPLAAVLAGRKAEPLIKRLTALCEERHPKPAYPGEKDLKDQRVVLLRQCLLDEVQVTPPTLRAALRQMARWGSEEFSIGSVLPLRRGKFGDVFQDVAEEMYFGTGSSWDEYSQATKDLALEAVFHDQPRQLSDDVAEMLERSLRSEDRIQQARAAFVCMWLAYQEREVAGEHRLSLTERFRPLRDAIGRLLSPDDPPLALSAAWALCWTGSSRLPNTHPEPNVIRALFRLWREADSSELGRYAAWAFATQLVLSRDTFAAEVWGDCDTCFEQTVDEGERNASLVLAWYRRHPWSDSELAEKLSEIESNFHFTATFREMLATLGKAGRRVLEEWDAKEKKA
ncbi:MAG: NACHT domain-containing protein [Phycisphaerae bacterium]|jgi:hypothetical protein|nr:NACHT domain-containing protein [Phycisphaerae bacterium]